MCGRYALNTTPRTIAGLFDLDTTPNLPPRYNIAPTQEAPVVRRSRDGRHALAPMRWGLVPFWATEVRIGAKMINARAETVAEMPAFRRAFAARRCLVPADGFYEWKKDGKARRPFRIGLRNWEPFAFAGLWARWCSAEGEVVRSFTIITTDANGAIQPIHNRMPVILDPADYAAWLDPGASAVDLDVLLRPCPAERFALHEVSARVNSHVNDDPACLDPLRTLFDHGLEGA
jgi:putative SOS response-associated peptidase YedK